MLIPLILTFGCITFLIIGIVLVSWAITEMTENSIDIKNIIVLISGIVVVIFGFYCMAESFGFYRIAESAKYCHKKEITTSIPAQIDTIITIRNSVPDTVYIYKFNSTEK